MRQDDVIGVVRKHRWASIELQRARLEADGCSKFVDLDKTRREALIPFIRKGTVIKATWAFLLTSKRGVRAGLADYSRFAERIAKLPRDCSGWIKDVDTGLVADTPGTRKAMLSVVREQLMRSHRGLAASESARRGPKELVLDRLQLARAEAIWRNTRDYRTWDDAEAALQEQVHPKFTKWRANRLWPGERPKSR